MSRKFMVPIDLTKNELQNAVIQNLTGSPASPVAGQVYYDSTANTLYYYNGSGWINAGGMTAGILSARPSAGAGNVGTFYYATDNKHIYYSDGSVWTQANEFGSPANLGSSQADGTALSYSRADHVHRHTNTDHSGINLSALDVPLGNISLNSHKITNLATPTANNDAANKLYVDNAVAGLTWKSSVNLLATTDVTLNGTTGTLVIDGHTALDDADAGYRILLLGQSTAADNGIYEYSDNGTVYALNRAADADVYTELISASVFVSEGTAYGKTSWVQANHYLTSFAGQDWVQFSGAGTYVAGSGLALDGNIFNVGTASTARIVVNSDTIDLAAVSQTNSTTSAQTSFINAITVDSFGRVEGVSTAPVSVGTGVAGVLPIANGGTAATSAAAAKSSLGFMTRHSESIGTGSTTTVTVTHGMGTKDVIVQVFDNSSPYAQIECDVNHTSTTAVTLVFATAPTTDQYRVVVIG